jgi:hypothetical protein
MKQRTNYIVIYNRRGIYKLPNDVELNEEQFLKFETLNAKPIILVRYAKRETESNHR